MSELPRFDQKTWQADTTWDGPIPAPTAAWTLLQAEDVASEFKEALRGRIGRSEGLKAMLAQHLRETGISAAELQGAFSARIGRKLRPQTFDRLLTTQLERASWKIRFANLVSGRFTELVFLHAYADHLHALGLELEEETLKRNFLDFRVRALDSDEAFELSLNIKNAGVQMAQAETYFGLASEDTIPMATYKTFGAEAAAIPPLLYVYLVDWTLIERLRHTYWREGLSDAERQVFRLLTSVKGFSRNVEDDFIAATVEGRLDRLLEGVGYADLAILPFRVVSAAKCQQIFYEKHGRSPYVFVRRMNTDPNVHISVAQETVSFGDLMSHHLRTPESRAALLLGLACKKDMAIPDPPL